MMALAVTPSSESKKIEEIFALSPVLQIQLTIVQSIGCGIEAKDLLCNMIPHSVY